MTLKEFKDYIGDAPDDTPIAIMLEDGELDYVTCVFDSEKDDLGEGERVIVISRV